MTYCHPRLRSGIQGLYHPELNSIVICTLDSRFHGNDIPECHPGLKSTVILNLFQDLFVVEAHTAFLYLIFTHSTPLVFFKKGTDFIFELYREFHKSSFQ